MRACFTLLVLSLCCNLLRAGRIHAQTVYYSPKPGLNAEHTRFELIGRWGSHRVVYTKRFGKGVFRLYTERMTLIDTVVLSWLPRNVKQLDFIPLRSRFVALYQYEKKRNTLFAAAVLDGTGHLLRPPVPIVRSPVIRNEEDRYAFVASSDKRRILVYQMLDGSRGEWTRALTVLLDSNLQRIESDTLAIPYQRSEGPPLAVRLSNAGGWYLLYATSSFTFDSRLKGLTLFYKPARGKALVTRKFFFPSRAVAGPPLLTLAEQGRPRLWLNAFRFGDKNRHLAGLMCWQMDPATLAIMHQWEAPFSPPLRKAFADRRSRRKAIFDDYVPNALVFRRSGDALLVAGQSFVDAQGQRHDGSVALFPLDTEGFAATPLKIERPLSRYGGPFPGPYLMVNQGNALHFLINQPHEVSRFLTSSIYLLRDYRYAPGSGVEVRPVMAKQDQGYQWLTQMGKQISDREVLIPCLSGRQLYFGSIRY